MADASILPIAQATKDCLESFLIYKERSRVTTFQTSSFVYRGKDDVAEHQQTGAIRSVPDEWADNRLADFNLWASGVGALAAKRASLDARLEAQPELVSLVVNLLKLLKSWVDDCVELVHNVGEVDDDANSHGANSGVEPDSGLPSTRKTLSQTKREVGNVLDQLARIAFAIRASGTQARLQKADGKRASQHQGDLQRLRDHLTILILATTRPLSDVLNLSGDIRRTMLSEIENRLVECNLKRRNRFLYQQSHAARLGNEQTRFTVTSPATKTAQNRLQEIPAEAKKLSPAELHIEDQAGKPAYLAKTDTVATLLSAQGQISNTVPRSVQASTLLSVTVSKASYPSVPKLGDRDTFRCPCCCLQLRAIYAEPSRWKKHLAEDLSPYTCILLGCPTPEQLFSSKEAWKAHLKDDHTMSEYWKCLACKERPIFERELDLSMHIVENHQDTIPVNQVPMLLSDLKYSTPNDMVSCPLCRPSEHDDPKDPDTLLNHVAEHVHDFSIRALPWPSDDVDITPSEDSINKVRSWIINSREYEFVEEQDDPEVLNTVGNDGYLERPAKLTPNVMSMDGEIESPAAENILEGNYFDDEANDYFNDKSGTRSSAASASDYQELLEASGPVSDLPQDNQSKRLDRRLNIITELLNTESIYKQEMTVVVEIYQGTCNLVINSKQDEKVIFINAPDILAFSTMFLDALSSAAKSVYVLPKYTGRRSKRIDNENHDSTHGTIDFLDLSDKEKARLTSIGAVFLDHLPEMERCYTEFLKNSEAASAKLKALQDDEKVKAWLDECRDYAKDLTTAAWGLDSLLIKPSQRLMDYSLLIKELCDVTPENHPDFIKLDIAAREIIGVIKRINDSKRRMKMVEKIAQAEKNKRKDRLRLNLQEYFGRRNDKQKIQPELLFQFQEYYQISAKLETHSFKLQIVIRDIEMYITDVRSWVNKFDNIAVAMEDYLNVGSTAYLEIEIKWRRFRATIKDLLDTALTSHVTAVRSLVIDPITTLVKLYGTPQRLMERREERISDYAKYKTMKDGGEIKKLDKQTSESAAMFLAINDTLEDELPRLFEMTSRLVNACLLNFVQLQLQWQGVWKRNMTQVIELAGSPPSFSDIVTEFSSDFRYTEAHALSLGICNGLVLIDGTGSIPPPSQTTDSVHQQSEHHNHFDDQPDGQSQPTQSATNSASPRITGTFNSMPISDSSVVPSPIDNAQESNVLFLAVSVYEFNIGSSRREAGYPYLTYVQGEIFDVIAEKGELWLARNQDDDLNRVGWIWSKHFSKLGP